MLAGKVYLESYQTFKVGLSPSEKFFYLLQRTLCKNHEKSSFRSQDI